MARNKKVDQEVVNEEVLEQQAEGVQVTEEGPAVEETAVEASAETASVENVDSNGEELAEPVFHSDATGQEISRSAYIRQEFLKNRSRGEIAKELGVAYGIVYAATANMENEVHKTGEGSTGAARSVMIEHPETGEQIARADYAREQVGKGRSRNEVAKELGVAYATVYAATKDIDTGNTFGGGGGRITIEVDGEQKPRAEYIREQFEAGKSRREIANELGVDYAVVWAATKADKVDSGASAASTEEVVAQEEQAHEESERAEVEEQQARQDF